MHLVQIEKQDVPRLSFKTHPNINKELFNGHQIVGARDPNRPFPSGQNETHLVKWRIQGLDESFLPLTGMLQFFCFLFFLASPSLLFWTCVTCFCHLQSIAGLQCMEIQPMLTLTTKLRRCLICRMLSSLSLCLHSGRLRVLNRQMENGSNVLIPSSCPKYLANMDV